MKLSLRDHADDGRQAGDDKTADRDPRPHADARRKAGAIAVKQGEAQGHQLMHVEKEFRFQKAEAGGEKIAAVGVAALPLE